MTKIQKHDSGVRRAEIVAALSRATDLAIGQPVEFSLQSCVLGLRLGGELAYDRSTLREIYYQALLRYIGCNAETDALAALVGDEIEFRRLLAPRDMGSPADLMPLLFRAIVAQAGRGPGGQRPGGESQVAMVWKVLKGLAASKEISVSGFRAHCETAERLARRLGCDDAIVGNLGQLYERWDGKGHPEGLKGEAIAPAVRVVCLAQDALVLRDAHGLEAALAIIGKRAGGIYDPRMARVFAARAGVLMEGLPSQAGWENVLALEPGPQVRLSEDEFEEACLVMADFADIKSPYTSGHSRAVAKLAWEAGRRCGLPETDLTALRRAALVHDIGQVAVSSGIFAKPGALTESEREKVRLHPYHAERILGRSPALACLGESAARHHERMDGSGYHRGARGEGIPPASRILAAAEAYQAMIEARPHRPAHTGDQAAAALRKEVREGRLDSEAVSAVLESAGHRVMPVRRELMHGLTAREMEILRLVARGKTMKEMGLSLGISPKTADNHIQNLYAKIGTRTRAGATLFAIEHGLLE
jgi:HD-GYP domain-containing protein (c-di-GMP phosphodiesterase class II)